MIAKCATKLSGAQSRFSYKVVLPVSDPVGNSVRLTDLRPYTAYTLSIRSKDSKNQVIAALNFSTSGKGKML